jgi:DNA end-binding protein Ku
VEDQSRAATRITLRPHDPGTGEEVDKAEVVKGYEYNRGQFVTFTPEELKALDVESSKVIDLDKFVPRDELDPVYFDSPYYVYPDGPIAVETLRVIGAAMAEAGVVGLGRLTLSRRERMVMVEPRGTGMALFTLRAAAEVRASQFGSADGDLDAEMVAIAGAIIGQRTGDFDPSTFRDSYQEALQQLIEAKMKGLAIEPRAASTPSPVIDLMAALKRSLAEEAPTPKRTAASRERRNKTAPDRRQAALLLPLSGGSKRKGERSAEPTTIGTRRRRKA